MFKIEPVRTSDLYKVSGCNALYHGFRGGLLLAGRFDPLRLVAEILRAGSRMGGSAFGIWQGWEECLEKLEN